MPSYVALLRAVNLGTDSTVSKATLISMFEEAGYENVRTYIASGNVVFSTRASARKIVTEIERRIQDHFGRPGRVHVRTAAEMAAVLDSNPFPNRPPNKVAVFFLDVAPTAKALLDIRGANKEEVRLGARELYAYYPDGMGRSKLVIPLAKTATARNMNTVATLSQMLSDL